MIFGLLLNLFISYSWGITCSSEKLTPIFVGGVLQFDTDSLEIGADIRRALKISKLELDQKGFAPVEVVIPGFTYDIDSLLKTSADVLEATNPRKSIFEIVATFYLEQIDDYFRNYTEEDLVLLEENLDRWIQEDKFLNRDQAVEAVHGALRPKIVANKKVLLIGFGAGNFGTNGAIIKLAQELGQTHENLSLIAHLLISPPRKNIARLDLTPFSYYSLNQDRFQAAQQVLVAKNSLEPNLNLTEATRTSLFYGSVSTYLSDKLTAGEIGVAAPKKNLQSHFHNFSRRALDKVRSNNLSCCNGRSGRLAINHFGCGEAFEECLGGFVEKGIDYDSKDKNVFIDKDASVCKGLTHVSGLPKIAGRVDIFGNIEMSDNAQIIGGNSALSSPITVDSLGGKLEIKGNSVVRSGGDLLKLKGSLLITGNTHLSGKLDIIGVDYSAFSIPNYKTAFNNAKISGETVIRGPVLISGKVKDSEITGAFDHQNILLIDSAADVESAKISGLGTIAADVKDKAVIEGERISPIRFDGVILLNGTTKKTLVTGEGTKVKGLVDITQGAVVKSGSYVWGRWSSASLGAISISASKIEASTVIGRGNLGNDLDLIRSEVEGCFFFLQFTSIVDSKLYGVGFRNTPLNNQVLGVKENAYEGCGVTPQKLSVENKIYNGGAIYNRNVLYFLFGY